MLCPKCGSVLPHNAVRCFDCGATVVVGDPSKGEVYDAGEAKSRIKARGELLSIRRYQIIALAGNLIMALVYLFTLIKISSTDGAHYLHRGLTTVMNSVVWLAVIVELALAVTGILMIIAMYRLRDCNEHFDRAFRIMIASILVSVVQSVFRSLIPSLNESLGWILAVFQTLVSLLYLYHFCKGAEEICRTKAPKVADRWSTYWMTILTIRLLAQGIVVVLTILYSSHDDFYTVWLYTQIALVIFAAVDMLTSIFLIRTLKDTTDYLYSTYIEGNAEQKQSASRG